MGVGDMMKFKDCFIDEKGNVWRTSTLLKHAEHLKVFDYDIRQISLDEPILWQSNNLRDYVNHFKRTLFANMDYPIILRSDGYVMDGWHRIVRALGSDIYILPAKKFKIDPEPDFKIKDEIDAKN